jgi:hypothetical protein
MKGEVVKIDGHKDQNGGAKDADGIQMKIDNSMMNAKGDNASAKNAVDSTFAKSAKDVNGVGKDFKDLSTPKDSNASGKDGNAPSKGAILNSKEVSVNDNNPNEKVNGNDTNSSDKDLNEKPQNSAVASLRRASIYLKESGSTTLFAENRLRTMSLNAHPDDTVAHLDEDDDNLIDPVCDPKHPHDVQFSDISMAAFSIRDGIVRSPCTVCFLLS